VNYIRSEVKHGNTTIDVSSISPFKDEKYLKPVLEDDALLYNLDDLQEESTLTNLPQSRNTAENALEDKRIRDLQEALDRLQSQFTAYRLAVQSSLEEQLSKDDKLTPASEHNTRQGSSKGSDWIETADSDYFTSYAYNSGWP
jgi:protein arginine N-methyltransferase 3